MLPKKATARENLSKIYCQTLLKKLFIDFFCIRVFFYRDGSLTKS